MSTAGKIRQFVAQLGADMIFTTESLLRFGTRNAVDLTASRLVKAGMILRLAAGVFVVAGQLSQMPSALSIAEAKAGAFEKVIYAPLSTSRDCEESSTEFLTSGCRTSFQSVHGRLYFKPASLRQLKQTQDAGCSGQISPGNLACEGDRVVNLPLRQEVSSLLVLFLMASLVKQVHECSESCGNSSRQYCSSYARPDAYLALSGSLAFRPVERTNISSA